MNTNIGRLSIVISASLLVLSMIALPSVSAVSGQARPQNVIVYDNPSIAGYGIVNSTNLSAAQGTFKVPSMSCTKSQNYTVAFAIELKSNSTGKYINGALLGVAAECSSGSFYGVSFAEWGNGKSGGHSEGGFPANDSIEVSITLSSSGDKLFVKDITSGKSFTKKFSGASANIAVWVGQWTIPVPKFSPIAFSGVEAAAVGGKLQPISDFPRIWELVLYNSSDDHILVQPTALSKSGTAFSLDWKASS